MTSVNNLSWKVVLMEIPARQIFSCIQSNGRLKVVAGQALGTRADVPDNLFVENMRGAPQELDLSFMACLFINNEIAYDDEHQLYTYIVM